MATAIAWKDLVKQAWLDRVGLSATGFYRTPEIGYDFATLTGQAFYYFCYGAAVTEVEIDTLTGEWWCRRVDIVHDVGRSINPAIDRGQIEGAYIQGLGWLTMEECIWDARGKLLTHGPSTYKIPVAGDVPEEFHVRFFDGANVKPTPYRSKAVGEPPLMLALSGLLRAAGRGQRRGRPTRWGWRWTRRPRPSASCWPASGPAAVDGHLSPRLGQPAVALAARDHRDRLGRLELLLRLAGQQPDPAALARPAGKGGRRRAVGGAWRRLLQPAEVHGGARARSTPSCTGSTGRATPPGCRALRCSRCCTCGTPAPSWSTDRCDAWSPNGRGGGGAGLPGRFWGCTTSSAARWAGATR
jgi:hypothetical protein